MQTDDTGVGAAGITPGFPNQLACNETGTTPVRRKAAAPLVNGSRGGHRLSPVACATHTHKFGSCARRRGWAVRLVRQTTRPGSVSRRAWSAVTAGNSYTWALETMMRVNAALMQLWKRRSSS